MYMSMKHTATTLKSPGAVRIYLPKFQCGPKHSEASEPTHPPKRHARISLSYCPVEEIGPRPYFSWFRRSRASATTLSLHECASAAASA